jgi:hypothetical protein
MTSDPFQQHRDDVSGSVLIAVCALSTLGALLTTLGPPLAICLGLASVAVVIGATRWIVCKLRERREDAADALAAAAWRAQHTPYRIGVA